MNIQRVLSVIMSFLVVGSSSDAGQTPVRPTIFAQISPGNRVDVIDGSTGKKREIYRSPRWSARRVSVSPNGDRISLLEFDRGRTEGANYSAPPQSELIVLDTTGRVVHRVGTNIQRYVWCGNACLACIVGTYSEGDFGFSPESAYVVDLVTGAVTPLRGESRPIDITWAAFDSSVLVKVLATSAGGPTVHRYDVATGTYSATQYHDIHFSASGRYYFHAPDLGDRQFRLFDARTNQELQVPTLTTIGTPVGWIPSGPNRLLLVLKDKRTQSPVPDRQPRVLPISPGEADMDFAEFDLDTRRVVRTLRGHVPRWAGPSGVVPLVTVDGRIHAITGP